MPPPSPDVVTRRGPWVLLALTAPVLGFAASSLFETQTDEEKKEKENEAERRTGIVQDMISSLETAELKDDESKVDKECEDGSQEEKVENAREEPGKEAKKYEEEQSEEEKVEVEEEENQGKDGECYQDDDYDDIGQIEFSTFFEKVFELAEVDPKATVLESGMKWCGKLLLKEIRTATTKTEAQKDVRYSDGSKLEDILDGPLMVDRLGGRIGFKVPKDLRDSVTIAYNTGWRVHKIRSWKDKTKALKMILLASETLPWVLASNALSTAATTISTLCLHYRAEVLQALRKSQSSRAPFYQATRALFIVELIASVSRTLLGQLNARVNKIMSKSLQVKLFLALLSKDTVWWAEQKDAYKYAWTVLDLPGQVKDVLDVPRNMINTLTSIFIQVQLVRAKSSEMLYAMVGLHWLCFFSTKGVVYLQTQAIKWAWSGLVNATASQMSWAEALNPEYVQMFQSFCRGPLEAQNLLKYTRSINRRNELSGAVGAVFSPVSALMSQGRSIAEYLNMGNLVKKGVMDLTEAETTLHYATGVGDKIELAYNLGGSNSLTALARAYDYISITSKINPLLGIDPGTRSRGHFVFEDVKFSYPGRKVPILKGVSFKAKIGEVVGITGTTGCGKSTILKLVERFYDVTGGRILLDGRDIRDYSPQWLRSQIVAVAQEPKLIPSTIRENLTFGCAQPPTMEQIEAACRSANIWDVLKDPQKFPNGLETEMERIQNVAGGEKQRICIARAILADPPVLLLDEATSALDEVSQAHVQEALNTLMKGRTTLVIAHRLSTIKDSDRIIGMESGKVVDNGTHNELLQKPNGVWKKLWEQQNSMSPKSGEVTESTDELPPVMPSLQRSTTSTSGRYDVLRQMLVTLGKTDDAKQRQQGIYQMQDLIDELETQACKTEKSSETVPTSAHLSRWTQTFAKIRALQKLGALGTTINSTSVTSGSTVVDESLARSDISVSSHGQQPPSLVKTLSRSSNQPEAVVQRTSSLTRTLTLEKRSSSKEPIGGPEQVAEQVPEN